MIASLAVLALASEIAMAKPPEPLEEIFPATQLIVDAVVVDMKADVAAIEGRLAEAPRQVVVLKVGRVHRGKLTEAETKSMTVVVTKPAAPYLLSVGVKGPWLVHIDEKTGEKIVLGRYGPDSWTWETIERKLQELDPAHLRP